MADVAVVAGVSAVTVSRALSSPDTVSKETRQRIDEAIRVVGYVPNGVAGSLRSSRTTLVATVIPAISHRFLGRMIQGITDELALKGLHLVLSTSGETLEGEEAAVRAFLAQRPRGLILHSTEHTPECLRMIEHAGIAVIETGDLPTEPIGTAVSYSNYAAAFALTEHLLQRGKKKIVMIGQSSNERSLERMRGYRDALLAANLGHAAVPMIQAQPGPGSGAHALNHLLAVYPETDGIIFVGDSLADGALLECHRRGISVPGQIAIASYDENDLSESQQPRLTTLRIPRYEIGRTVARTLMHILDGGAPASRIIDMGFELVVREST